MPQNLSKINLHESSCYILSTASLFWGVPHSFWSASSRMDGTIKKPSPGSIRGWLLLWCLWGAGLIQPCPKSSSGGRDPPRCFLCLVGTAPAWGAAAELNTLSYCHESCFGNRNSCCCFPSSLQAIKSMDQLSRWRANSHFCQWSTWRSFNDVLITNGREKHVQADKASTWKSAARAALEHIKY